MYKKISNTKFEVPEFLLKEEILEPDCIYMVIGGKEKMNTFMKMLDEKIDADNSSLKEKI